jgi:hypothetical protein
VPEKPAVPSLGADPAYELLPATRDALQLLRGKQFKQGQHEKLTAALLELGDLRVTVARIDRELEILGLLLAAWCPHGFDSSRSSDYGRAAEFAASVDRIKGHLASIRAEADRG